MPDYFTSTPITESSILDESNPSDVINFCLTANQNIEDLNITILPLNDARPGFNSDYKLVVKNIGTEIINDVSAIFTFDETKQSFISAIPSETISTSNSLNFSMGILYPFESVEVKIKMENFAPPTLNADDIIDLSALVMPNSNDYTPNDNQYFLEQIVVNAFDPNDKSVLQGETITIDQTDDYLDYIIRFQNTGSANASFVRIEDVLDPKLDWSTFKMVSASHDYQVNIKNNNKVDFIFNDIDLPYEALDEPNSNGYIAYKIKPKTTVEIGDVIQGKAGIYFDYNPPIITNTVSTEVTEDLNVNKYIFDGLTIYPNPTTEYFKIEKTNNQTIESIKLYNLSGKLIKEFSASDKYIVDELNSGVYILIIKTDRSETIKKLVKILY